MATIWYVDDDLNLTVLTKEALVNNGYDVEIFHDGWKQVDQWEIPLDHSSIPLSGKLDYQWDPEHFIVQMLSVRHVAVVAELLSMIGYEYYQRVVVQSPFLKIVDQ